MPALVLIVEDDSDLALTVESALTDALDVTCMISGKVSEARGKLFNQKFDCILLDIQLAGTPGDQLAEHVRQTKSNLNYKTPILITSGTVDRPLFENLKVHVNGFHVKPYDWDKLVASVGKAVGQPPPN